MCIQRFYNLKNFHKKKVQNSTYKIKYGIKYLFRIRKQIITNYIVIQIKTINKNMPNLENTYFIKISLKFNFFVYIWFYLLFIQNDFFLTEENRKIIQSFH